MEKKSTSKPLVFDLTPDEIEIFLEDVNDCLQAMETGILNLEQKSDSDTLQAIFRATHTLKAVVGTVGHHQMAELAHTLETIFDEMRTGRLLPSQIVADELFAAIDGLKALRDEVVSQQPSGVDVAALLARLHTLIEAESGQPQAPAAASSAVQRQLTPKQLAQLTEMSQAGLTIMEIEVAAAETFAPAARLYQVVIALMELGQIVAQQPALDDLSEDDERLWLILAGEVEPEAIESILQEIDDLAEVHLQPYSLEEAALPERSDTGRDSNGQGSEHGADELKLDKTVRISIERLDTLVNLVGELVTNRTRLLQLEEMLHAQYDKDEGVVGAFSELVPHFSHVVDQLQEEVMRARMLPIAALFNKFPRLVRDVARAGGKQVKLVISGEATELDRTVMEAISDPLVHLLRNAVDHGLESPEGRQAAGKPATGTVRLTAASMEGQIVITLADDGRGIDPAKIRQAAVSKGLLAEEVVNQLNEEEAIDFIFQPNLSTAREVTEMSGRGVGLDVVRTNIEQLGGSVVVRSQMGQGTSFQITLPLTLALVQTMLVVVEKTLYAIPVTSINGALYLGEAKLNTVKGRPTLDWQGSALPLLDLRHFFARSPQTGAISGFENGRGDKSSVVLVSWGKHRVGLVVDRIIGQQEIVVKSLSPLLGSVPGLSGATILGDGRIALIVDIPGLINAALRMQRAI